MIHVDADTSLSVMARLPQSSRGHIHAVAPHPCDLRRRPAARGASAPGGRVGADPRRDNEQLVQDAHDRQSADTGHRWEGALVLHILASNAYASTPPTITTVQGTRHGIVLTFSKPMDPAGASNVNNYAVRSWRGSDGVNGPFGLPFFGYHHSISSVSVPLRAAVYDPATNSVTLIPDRRLTYLGQVTVTQGAGSKKSSRPGHPSDAPLGLTDVDGNPINGNTTPGKFSLGVESGNPRPVSATSTSATT